MAGSRKSKLKPNGEKVLTQREIWVSGVGQPYYLRNLQDIQRLENALRSAERGATWYLFAIFRDMIASNSHLQAEWAKRKSVIIGNPETLIPYSNQPDDVLAAEVIREMIANCRNWYDGLNHLLDATLWPLAAVEKIYEPVSNLSSDFNHPVRFKLLELAPIDPTLLCFQLPYIPGYTMPRNQTGERGEQPDYFNPNDWESWLRFYRVNEFGVPKYLSTDTIKPDPEKHMIHRGNMLSPTIPPNFGGHLRAILFWDLLATQDRDWWAMMMQKHGMPLLVGQVDTQQKNAVEYMKQAMSLCMQLGGVILDRKAKLNFEQISYQDASRSHQLFSEFCQREISKIVVGQTLSTFPEKTGMGSGAAAQSEDIREDIRLQDTLKLSDTLQKQLFKQYLRVNGYRGKPPRILWGGMRPDQAENMARTLGFLYTAGISLDESGLQAFKERFGFGIKYLDKPTNPDDNKEPKRDGIKIDRSPVARAGDNPNPVKY
jgi:hypothetical protein